LLNAKQNVETQWFYQLGLNIQSGIPHSQWYISKRKWALMIGFIFFGSSPESSSITGTFVSFSLLIIESSSLKLVKYQQFKIGIVKYE